MKRACKAIGLVTFGLLTLAAVSHATTFYPAGDLLIGFTTGAGTDEIYDLGKESSITNGKTWNLASLLTGYGNFSSLNWGVIGNGTNAGTLRTAWTTTVIGIVPNTVTGTGAFGKLNTSAQNLGQNGPGGGIVAGQSAAVAASAASSWNTITLNGTLATDYVNAYENPNVIGVGSADFSQVLDDGSIPTLLGRFTLSANGIVTYNSASNSPTPPTAGFTGTPTTGTAPLKVIFTDGSTGSITNWIWNFGDGHILTNSTASTVTNIYTLPGTFTVTLTVLGAGGTNAQAQTGYIVVSSAGTPKINNAAWSAGQFKLSGTGGAGGAQYRIFTTTNLALPFASWTPVVTNTFLGDGSFAYTNATVKSSGFFRLVTP